MGFLRFLTVAITGATLVATAPGAVAEVPDDPAPTSIAALGDSITRGFNACGFYRDCPSRSWSTGTDGRVDSHGLRLGAVLGAEYNLAKTGARSDRLPDQARRAVAVGAQYVTIEIGANDACAKNEDDMTSTADYEHHISEALAVLHDANPQPRVFVASIPDLFQLWSIGHSSWSVRQTWKRLGVCRTMLAHANSLDLADVHRRGRVRTRTILYNDILASACAAYGPRCKFDDEAVFLTQFTRGQISEWDCFHPNESGQELLADVTWRHGFFGRPSALN